MYLKIQNKKWINELKLYNKNYKHQGILSVKGLKLIEKNGVWLAKYSKFGVFFFVIMGWGVIGEYWVLGYI